MSAQRHTSQQQDEKRRWERDFQLASWERSISSTLGAFFFSVPVSHQAPPAVCTLLLLLMLVLLQLAATSARTGRRLTAHIITTDARSHASNNCIMCVIQWTDGICMFAASFECDLFECVCVLTFLYDSSGQSPSTHQCKRACRSIQLDFINLFSPSR